MNTEEDEFKRIERDAKRQAAHELADTQVYTSEVAEAYAYRCGYEAGAVAEREACAKVCEDIGRAEEMQAIGNDYAEAIRARETT